jgi:hypothetical protein
MLGRTRGGSPARAKRKIREGELRRAQFAPPPCSRSPAPDAERKNEDRMSVLFSVPLPPAGLALPRRFPPPGKMHVSTRPDTFTSRSAQASSRTRPARGVYRRPQSRTHRPQRDIQRPRIAMRGRKANLRAMYKSPTLPPLSRTVTLHAPKRMVSTSRSQRTPHAHAFQPENRAETNAHSPPHPRSQPTPATACPEDARDIRLIPVKVRVGAYWAPNPLSLKRSTWQDERDGGEVKRGMRRGGGG